MEVSVNSLEEKRRLADCSCAELARMAGVDYGKTWRALRATSQHTASEVARIEGVLAARLRERQPA